MGGSSTCYKNGATCRSVRSCSRVQRQRRPASAGPVPSRKSAQACQEDPRAGQQMRARVAELSAKNRDLLAQLGDLRAQNAQLAMLGHSSTTPEAGSGPLPRRRHSTCANAAANAGSGKVTREQRPTQEQVSELAVENQLLWRQLAELRERNARLEDLKASNTSSPGSMGSTTGSKRPNRLSRESAAAQTGTCRGRSVDISAHCKDVSAHCKESSDSDTSASSVFHEQLVDQPHLCASFRVETPPDKLKEAHNDLVLLKATIAMQEIETDLRENHHINLKADVPESVQQEEDSSKLVEPSTSLVGDWPQEGALVLLKASKAIQEVETDLRENHQITLKAAKPQSVQRSHLQDIEIEEQSTSIVGDCSEDAGRELKSDAEGLIEMQASNEGNSDDEFLKYLDSFQTYAQQLFKAYADDPVKPIVDRIDTVACTDTPHLIMQQ